MKHTKLIAALVTAGSLFAVNSAHAIVPAVAAGVAALAGAAIGSAASQPNPPAVAVVPATPAAVAVAPSSTVVMGGPPTVVQEVIPAPRDGYRWEAGHYELRDGVNTWVSGHWEASAQ